MPTMHERASLIDAKNVLAAAQFFKKNGRNFGLFRESSKYDVIIKNEHYPPKAIFAIAYNLATGESIEPGKFGGSAKGPVHQKFKELGFEIINKGFYLVTEADFNRADNVRLGLIKTRQGQDVFRSSLLKERGKKCEVTGTDVSALLEAAHIIPHAEGANYNTSNGLLLRVDIHTLYDSNLLSIDENLIIHLAPSILKLKEYSEYQGKKIKSLNTTKPFREALKRRHKHFLRCKKIKS
jgi:hypothetical protein